MKLGGRDRQYPGKSSYPLIQFSLVKKKRIAMLRINVWKSVQTLILEMMNSCSVSVLHVPRLQLFTHLVLELVGTL